MGKICTFCKYKRPENRCALIFSNASVKQTERCWNYEPVEDVAPVVHAHWKEFEDYSGAVYPECSRCGLVWWLEEGTAEENEMYYCPKCGAKMDELNELNMLEKYLIDHDIPYERKDSDGGKDSNGMFAAEWHQVCVPVSDPRKKDWDAICHPGSYGYEEGKLEIMGTIVPPTAGDTVLGNLTADEVIKLIEEVAE